MPTGKPTVSGDPDPTPQAASESDGTEAMAEPRATSIKGTSGRGYRYETQVGVWFAAAMLANARPLPRHGDPVAIRFMTDDGGWLFDDQLITFRDGHRIAASVKSNQQFEKRRGGGYAANQGVVAEAWGDALGTGGADFDPEADRLALIAPPPPGQLAAQLDELQILARDADPEALDRRVAGTRSLRTLYESFKPPANLETARPASWLLARFEVITLDFESPTAAALSQSVNWCREALEPASAGRADAFYRALYEWIDQVRTSGGEFSRGSLIGAFRREFPLRFLAPSEAKGRIDFRTERNLNLIPTALGQQTHLERASARNDLLEGLREASYAAVTGRSGVGKTVITAQALRSHRDFDLVWVSAADLEQETAAVEADLEVGLQDPTASLAVVVIDGLDRSYDPQVFRSAARIIDLALAEARWHVALTSATESLPRVIDELAAHNLQLAPKSIEVPLLGGDDLAEVATAFPALRQLLANPAFLPILSNLKQLDLVVRTASPETFPTEAGLARLYWEKLVLRGERRHERAQFLEHLAERQAAQLEASTARSELGDVAALSSLEDDDICLVRGGRVSFSHDLYGDWTRVWLLDANHEVLAIYLGERLGSPLWHRAIRLRASGYLSAGDIEGWRRSRAELPADDELVDDLFVEAALYCAQPAEAIRALWDDLAANDGRLLKRLLGRLRLVATTPDELMVMWLRAVDPELESYARVTNRKPIWPLWVPALQVLGERPNEVVALAPTSAAQVATIWLERTPDDWPLRIESAQLALAAATRMYELKRDNDILIKGQPDEMAYQAFLAGAVELPDEVSDLALRLAGRREPRLRRRFSEEVGDAWPDGPQGEVDDAFRKVCLNTAALQRLMCARPTVASEVLFGLLIEEPRERRDGEFGFDLFEREFGLHRMHGWITPMWHRGPFIGFLQVAPAEAIRFIASLVNFATARFMERERAGGYDPGSIEIELPDGTLALWDGDARIYGWYRGSAPNSVIVTSALMALEFWLYQRLDAGEDVDEWIRLIYSESRSTAFAGLLVGVGLHTQPLFAEILKPLFGVPELYRWDRERLIALESSAGLMAGFALRDPAVLVKQAQEFHALPHRRIEFEQLALAAFLNQMIDLDEFFREARERWSARAEALPESDEERKWLERLGARFDRENYEVGDAPGGEKQWIFTADDLDEEARRELDHANEAQMLLGVPIQIRKALDGEAEMTEAQFVELLRLAREQEEKSGAGLELFTPTQEAEHRANIICGAAAVGIELFRQRLRQHPDEESWCIDKLTGYIASPPENEEGRYFPGTPWEWHVFCAHALPTLWAEDPRAPEYRNLAALLAMFPNDSAVKTFSASTARVRQALGEEYARLLRFMLDWAQLRREMRDLTNRRQWSQPAEGEDDAAMEARFARAAEGLRGRQVRLVSAFVKGELEAAMPPWSQQALRERRVKRDSGRRRNQLQVVSDVEYLSHALEALPSLDAATDDNERSVFISFWRESVRYLSERLGGEVDDDREVEGTPYESDYWLLRRIGQAVAEMRVDEDPAALWRPMLDIATGAHYWVDDFLHAFIGRGLAGERPRDFLATWQAMTAYAHSAPSWNGDGRYVYHSAENWIALLGLDLYSAHLWTASNQDLAEAMATDFTDALTPLINDDRTASALIRFLGTEGSAPVRSDLLALLAGAAEQTELWRDRDDRISTPLAELLELLFRRNDATIREPAFTKMLRYLAARQVPLAVELLSRVGRS